MTAQTDLRVEAAHLIRFFRNFAPVRGSVTPPFPLPDYISEGALIETFEPGWSSALPRIGLSSSATSKKEEYNNRLFLLSSPACMDPLQDDTDTSAFRMSVGWEEIS